MDCVARPCRRGPWSHCARGARLPCVFKSLPYCQQTRDANHSNSNKAADHGERIFVDSQHMAPHRDIASDQSDCRRLGSKFLWLRCNGPIFYCGKEMAKTRVMLELSRSWLAERMLFDAG